jgi:hypothetical protein
MCVFERELRKDREDPSADLFQYSSETLEV